MGAKKIFQFAVIAMILMGSVDFSGAVKAQFQPEAAQQVSSTINNPPLAIESGPYGGTINDLKIDPNTTSTLYAASNYGVFKSTRNGDQWTLTGLTGKAVYALAIDPVNPANVFAGTRGQGFYRSGDGGLTWTASTSQVILDKIIYTLAVDPVNPNNLYAGGREANVDGTTSGDWGGGVFKSTDAGATWQAINTGLPEGWVYSLVLDPKTPSTVYAGTHSQGVYKSKDGGATWQAKNGGLVTSQFPYTDDLKIRSLAINPQDSNNLLVAVWGGGSIFETSDGAEGNWQFAGKAFYLAKIRTVAFNPGAPTLVYAGKESGGLFYNGNGGLAINWRPYTGQWDNFSDINAIAINPANGFIFLGVQGAGVIRSTDGGATWQAVNQGLSATTPTAIVADPFSSSTLYAATNGTGIFKSTDKGATWSNFSWPGQWDWAQNVAVDPETPNTLYVATENSGIAVSPDGGTTWAAINNNLPASPIKLPPNPSAYQPDHDINQSPDAGSAIPVTTWVAVAHTSPSITLYVGTFGNGIYQSKDGGHSWKHVDYYDEQVNSIAVYPNDPQSIIASTSNLGLVQINNDGGTYTNLSNKLPSLNVLSVLVDPTTPATLYAGTPNGVYVSPDNGATWSLYGLSNDAINAMAIDPERKTTFYAGTQVDGLMKTDDGGSTWVPSALPGAEVDALLLDPASRLTLYAGVNGGSVFNLGYNMFISNLFIKVVTPTP